MRFLSPLALSGLALIALPVLIHLLVRRHASRLDFPSLRFLRETPSFRLRPRKVQQPLLLALRAAALLLLILAIARPLITFGTRTARTHIILLDASLSMQAAGRVAAAKEQARAIVNALAAGERAVVISCADEAQALSPVTSDQRVLGVAIDRYQAASGAANYAACFADAAELLEHEPPGEAFVEVISDFQQSGLRSAAYTQPGAFTRVNKHPVGAELGRNAFLLDEAVASSEKGIELDASEVVAASGERSGGRRSWALDASAGARAEIDWRTESNGQMTARLRTLAPDDFDADDERFLSFNAPRAGRALLVEQDENDGDRYLSAALAAAAGEAHFALEQKASLPASASELNAYALVTLTLHGQPDAHELSALAEYARAGGTVWLCLGRDVDTASWNGFAGTEAGGAFPFTTLARKGDETQALSLGAADADADALSFLGEGVLTALRAVRMHEGYAVTPREGAATVMRWNDGAPAFVSQKFGSGIVHLFAASPARAAGELGASVALPALASSIARASLSPREPLSYSIGERVSLGLEPETSVKIFDAEGKMQAALARELMLRPVAYFPKPGIYRVEANGLTRYLAFNAPAAESATALATPAEIESLFAASSNASETSPTAWRDAAERRGNSWRYFLGAAFLLLVVE
ncbi:MAG: BatA and WFA domain-containing protein, partial [Acidobacteria bacterium]|nr:BatA and WFA domain-containing protein [Acidobacteriota bacterium]